ncbi:putative uncharacterized protein [Prevotella sp. CAG:924]|nr:putative uncharacterized protein [Prevotella sp. CAG:924]
MTHPTSIFKPVRNFLFRLLNKEFLIFLFFLFLSGVFWLMMTLNETYEKELKIPVRLVGVPRNIVITTDLSDSVRVTLRDKGFVLISYMIHNKLSPLIVNFDTYANKQTGQGVVSMSDLQKMVKQELLNSTVILSVKMDSQDFFFNYGRRKRVKIQLIGNIRPAKNYYLSHVEFSPESVTVYANKQALDSIRMIQTEFQDIVNFDDTVVRRVRLKAARGVKVTPSTVTLRLYPDILTEESMEVPITAINKPDDLIIRTFPPKVKVIFTVGVSMFRSIRPSDFVVVVDYKEIAAHPSDKCNLYLKATPHAVRSARLETTQVDYLIEQQ